MPTQITTAQHGDSISGSMEKRVDIDASGRLWVLVVQYEKARFFYSVNGGTTWSLSSGSDLDLGHHQDTAVPSFYIDADGYAHTCWVRWHSDPQVIIYARGVPRSGGGWSWTQKKISPASGRTGVDSDVIAFRNGAGWVAWVCYDLGKSGNGVKVARVDISANGSLSVGATEHGPPTGAQSYQCGSLEFKHTGNGRTPTTTPDVYAVIGRQSANGTLLGHRAAYSGGVWTWQTPVTISASTQTTHTVLCTVFDGANVMIAWAAGTSTLNVSEWAVDTGTVTARNPPALPGGTGTVKAVTLSHDPVTDDIHVLAYGASDGDIIYNTFTRATTSWGTWVTLVSRSAYSGDGDVQAVRHPPRDSIDAVYTTGDGPYQVWHTLVAALVRAPAAPTLTAPPNGAILDLAAGATFTWAYSPVSPGDTQQAYQLRRQVGAVTEYWNAGASAWQTANFVNTVATEAFTGANGAAWPAQWSSPFGSALTGATFDIQSNRGRIVAGTGGSRAGRRLGSTMYTDLEYTGTFQAVASTAEPQVYWRMSADTFSGYALVISAANGVRVQQMVNNVWSTRHSGFGPTISTGTDYKFRIRHQGASLAIRVWPAASGEPSTWDLAVLDTLYPGPGYVGVGQWYSGQSAQFDDLAVTLDDPVFNASSAERAEIPPGKFNTGTTYTWGVRTRSSTGADSPWSTSRSVTASVNPAVVVSAPAGLVMGESTPLVTWTYTSVFAQRDFEVRVVQMTGAEIDPGNPGPSVWGSGVVGSSIAREIRVATSLDNDGVYRAYVRATDVNGSASTWAYSNFSISILPPSGPLVEVIDDYHPDTEVPRMRLDVIARSNYLAREQAAGQDISTVFGWEVDANVTLAIQPDDSANQLLPSLKMTAVAAGAIRARTAVGEPPEAPLGQAQPPGPLAFPVIENVPYTAVASFKSDLATRAARVVIRWYDADDGTGALISESVSDQETSTDTAYTQAQVTALAPLGARLARMVVEVLAAEAAEVFYVARMSLHPGRDIGWQPGGYAQTQTLRIERSIDGETTWTTLFDREKPDLYQRMVEYDRSAPFGVEVAYRAYTDVDPGAGAVLTSAVSPVSTITVESGTWAVRDPDDLDGEVRAWVTDYTRADAETISVHRVAGRYYPVVDSEGAESGTGSLTMYVPPAMVDPTVEVLTRVGVMVVQSPSGLVLRVRLPRREYAVADVRARSVQVEFVEVDA